MSEIKLFEGWRWGWGNLETAAPGTFSQSLLEKNKKSISKSGLVFITRNSSSCVRKLLLLKHTAHT